MLNSRLYIKNWVFLRIIRIIFSTHMTSKNIQIKTKQVTTKKQKIILIETCCNN